MTYKASLKYSPGSTYKYSQVADLIRKNANNIKFVRFQLKQSKRAPAAVFLKLLNSCVANAINLDGLNEEQVCIKSVEVGKAFTLNRSTTRGRGGNSIIQKRYSYLQIELIRKLEIAKSEKKLAKKKESDS